METKSRPEIEVHAHHLLLMILRCKNGKPRAALSYGTLERRDEYGQTMRVALDWALERGFLKFEISASNLARNQNRASPMHYLTKAGKAWLRSFGNDFGSVQLFRDRLALAKARALPENRESAQ